jgi:hypothetical protein
MHRAFAKNSLYAKPKRGAASRNYVDVGHDDSIA